MRCNHSREGSLNVALDAAHLLSWKIPDKVQMLSRRDVAFYALSVGVGRDPADQSQLRYVDPDAAGLTALPAMVLVLGYPGFWLGDPKLGLDAGRILHVEQSFQIFGNVPVEGRIVGRTRVLDVVDRGPDKGVCLYSERLVSDENGRVFARLLQTHLLRGYGGYSGGVQSSKPAPRQSFPTGQVAAIVDSDIRPEQALFYRLNGDMNPLHSDPAVARSAGFPAPIMHGMCTFSVVAKALLDRLCHKPGDRLVSMSARFTGPLYPGERLRTEVWADGSFRALALDRNATVLGQGCAMTSTGAQAMVEDYVV